MGLKNNNRSAAVIIILFLSAFTLSADGRGNILATNSWTAAFARMAGAESAGYTIEQLAPSNMEHPPEYELKPSDVRKIRDADIMVFAGYEILMKTVLDSFSKPEEQMVQINTSYSPLVLEVSVLAVAERLGTIMQAKQNISDYRREIAFSRQRLKDAGLYGAPVLVQFHQKALAQALGFEILGVFGPQPLEVRQIAGLGKTKPLLIIDNAHNPMAAPLHEILGTTVIELVNFPGFSMTNGMVSPGNLTGILKMNVEKLLTGLQL